MRKVGSKGWLVPTTVGVLTVMLAGSAFAQSARKQPESPAVSGKAAPNKAAENQEAASKPLDPKSSQYCGSIADAAADARYVLQKESLSKMEAEIEGRIKVLEAKRAEYEEWLKRRNAFLDKADEQVVTIYSRMRPDAAAVQLANMDEEIAAAILSKLNPRNSSAILNEMEPARAAQLANVMTDAPNRNSGKRNEKL